jgi:hypothetical protein
MFPKNKFKGYSRPEITPRNHYHHWVDACRHKTKTVAGFDYASPLTEVILLGTVALRCPDRELAWDAEQMKITNLPEANQYLSRPYREDWMVTEIQGFDFCQTRDLATPAFICARTSGLGDASPIGVGRGRAPAQQLEL